LKDPSTGLDLTGQDVEVLRDSITKFQERLQKRFDRPLNKSRREDWLGWLKSSPARVQYGLFVCKEVYELRRRIDISLKSIIISLGLENHELTRQVLLTGIEMHALVDHLVKSLPDLSVDLTKAVKSSAQDEINQSGEQFAEITD
jgi:hypothetical protein